MNSYALQRLRHGSPFTDLATRYVELYYSSLRMDFKYNIMAKLVNFISIFILLIHATSNYSQTNNKTFDLSAPNLARSFAAKCKRKCLNDGVCLDGVCTCKAGFSGPQCERSWNTCLESPLTIPHSVLYTNGTFGKIVCFDDFEFGRGVNSIILNCVLGKWTYDGLSEEEVTKECVAACNPPCENGGTCFIGNKCACPTGFIGTICSTRFCSDHRPSMIEVMDKFDLKMLCLEGYELDKSRIKVDIECIDTIWHVSYKQIHCKPLCDPECSENGFCALANECQCMTGFHGAACKSKICIDRPKNLKYMNVNGTFEDENYLTCEDGYKLITGETKAIIVCENGKWVYQNPFSDNFPPRCYPVCQLPCLNRGSCVAPNICKCPEGFTGKTCSKRYDTTVNGKHCHFPFTYRGQYYSSCTKVDRKYPWCAIEVNSEGKMSNWGLCYADLGVTRLVKGLNNKPCLLPFSISNQSIHECVSKTIVTAADVSTETSWCSTDLYTDFEVELNAPNGPTTCLSEREYLYFHEIIFTVGGGQCGVAEQDPCINDLGWTRSEISKDGKNCVFPFRFKGFPVYKCVSSDGEPKWCATSVDESLEPKDTSECIPDNNEGHENSDRVLVFPQFSDRKRFMVATLLTESARGRRCIFPFRHNNELKFHCTTGESPIPWCATKVDINLNVIESDFCLPDHDFFKRQLLNLQREHKDHSSLANLKELIVAVNNLRNSVYSRYVSTLGYRRLELLMKGHPISSTEPHLTPRFKDVDADEYLKEISTMETKTNFAQFFGLFPEMEPATMKAYQSEALISATEKFMRENDLLQEYDDDYEAYAIALRTFNLGDGKGQNFFKSFPLFGSQRRSFYNPTDDEINDLEHDEISGRSFLLNFTGGEQTLQSEIFNPDELFPSSVSYEQCEPFILDGKWYGYGSCVNIEGSEGTKDFNCAIRTSQEGKPIEWDLCIVKTESEGYYPTIITKSSEYYEKNLIATIDGEPCVFPYKYEGKLYTNECVKENGDPLGFCPLKVNEDFTISDRGGCIPDELLLRNNFSLKMMGKSSNIEEETENSATMEGSTTDASSASESDTSAAIESATIPQFHSNDSDTIIIEHINITKTVIQIPKISQPEQVAATTCGEECTNNLVSTTVLSTEKASTPEPSSEEPTPEPSSEEPTPEPSSKEPTPEPSSEEPSTPELSSEVQATPEPSSEVPSTPEPSAKVPSTPEPSFEEPTPELSYGEPSATEPSSVEQSTPEPRLEDPPAQELSSERISTSDIATTAQPSGGLPSPSLVTALPEQMRPLNLTYHHSSTKLVIKTIMHHNCVIPFTYKSKEFSDCVDDGINLPWCPVKVDFNGIIVEKEPCSSRKTLHMGTKIILKTTETGASCALPFIYKGITYHSCTDIDASDLWCPTKLDGFRVPLFGSYCTGSLHIRMQLIFTKYGALCRFPFVYKNQTYHSCINGHSFIPWCYTDVLSDAAYYTQGECHLQTGDIRETIFESQYGSQVNIQRCKFPFIYKGHTYLQCTVVDSVHSLPWCATVVDFHLNAVVKEPCYSGREMKIVYPDAHQQAVKLQGLNIGGSISGAYVSKHSANTVLHEVNEYYNRIQDRQPIRVIASSGSICIFPFPYHGDKYFSCVFSQGSSEYSFCATHISTDGGLTWEKCAAFEIEKKYVEDQIVNCYPGRYYGDIFQELRDCFEIKKRTANKFLNLEQPLKVYF